MSYFRSRPQSGYARSKSRLTVEVLEERYCLDGAPAITFSVTPLDHGRVLISGQVSSDSSASNLTVNLGGAVSDFAQTDNDGMFSVITRASSLGLVDITASDSSNMQGDSQAYFTVPPPTVSSFQITYEGNGYFAFSGNVSDAWAAGMKVTFTGLGCLEGHAATVNSDGSFLMSMQMSPGQAALVTAHVWDFWGNQSQAQDYINTTV